MKKRTGFTLIELLIVVAIIAILAAIAVPNFIEAQIRARVASASTDLRTMSTGLESFQVDYNVYPRNGKTVTNSVNAEAYRNKADGSALDKRPTFAGFHSNDSQIGTRKFTLTTPVSFLAAYPKDIFAETNGAIYGYINVADMGWVTWSYGPNGDELGTNGSELDFQFNKKLASAMTATTWRNNTIYDPGKGNPLPDLIKMTYDATNGSTSPGDIWKING